MLPLEHPAQYKNPRAYADNNKMNNPLRYHRLAPFT